MENKYFEEEVSFRELASRLGITDLNTPNEYDIKDEGYEILSFDDSTKQEVWKPLEMYVVKKNAKEHYQINTLHGTADHKVMFEGKYLRLADHPGAELVKSPIQVVDCQVADTHNYLAEGQINHNTTTPGGMAIPYSTSTRIKLIGGKHLEDKDKNVYGIEVTAKTIKNKVARPFRECTFQIHFGKGIREHEQVFDFLRQHCEKVGAVKSGDVSLMIEGTGAWKTFTVTNLKTKAEVFTKKFNKSNFDEILYDPKNKGWMDSLMDDAYIMKPLTEEHATYSGVNSESIEEITAARISESSAGDLDE